MSQHHTSIGGVKLVVQGRWNIDQESASEEFEFRILDQHSNAMASRDGSSSTTMGEVADVLVDLQSKGSTMHPPTFMEKANLAHIISMLANISYPSHSSHYA